MAQATRPHVVIVGAGFGGLWTAKALAQKAVDVTLIDRNNYHTFFPLLYQVAAAELVPTDIAHPVRSIFRDAPNVSVRLADVERIDLDGRTVHTDRGALSYDILVVAIGSEPAFFGVPGAEEHAFPLRWMSDAIPLRHHVLTRFEAAVTADRDDRRRLLTFAVVGGGPTGVEYAGALSELVFGPLARDFPTIPTEDVRVVLLEGADRLLAGMRDGLGRYAVERLGRRGVEVRFGAQVEEVGPRHVLLPDGERLDTETVVWTAGVRGDPRVAEWGLSVGRAGRVVVEADLSLADRPEVFVVGDLAYREDADGEPLPQVAQVAIQGGRRVGGNILLRTQGRETEPFEYKDLGMLAVIGRNAAVAQIFGRAFRGWLAWLLWLAIHIGWLIGFRNRALVLVNWGWNYLFFRRAVRLILPGASVEAVVDDDAAVPSAPEAGRGPSRTREDP